MQPDRVGRIAFDLAAQAVDLDIDGALADVGLVADQFMLQRAGGDLTRITGPLITEAAQDGDAGAIQQLEELARWLGEGMEKARRWPVAPLKNSAPARKPVHDLRSAHRSSARAEA